VPAKEPAVVARGKQRIKISPVARKKAEEHALDITRITGTGPEGRIVRKDIEKAIANKTAAPAAASVPTETIGEKRVKQTIPLRGMRGAIAEHMHRSLSVSAQLTAMGEIDMTHMVRLRKDLVDQESVLGTRITYTDLFVFAISRVLRNHPRINSSIIGNEIKVWQDINIGIAVALDEGLIVPVVKAADQKSFKEISLTIKTLAEKARERKLVAEEITGGTFTLSNLGAVGAGYRFETVIINQPESAILGTGAITERAVVRDGQIVIRPIMTYYFTYDHRVIDGAVAAKFMASLIRVLEDPGLLIV
jgi:pyruvate dehydrogenase E2 component (dihydrolipoamide acetyltransferase)/2-oxoglutarate dehydrogenase E2 component (dihydrolipoamide succinyltransferase)